MLSTKGLISEVVNFPSHAFNFMICTADQKEIEAEYIDNNIKIYFPKHLAVNWPENDEVGYSAQQKINSGILLNILIEKDFVCMDQPLEGQKDFYDNPRIGK
jgi:hypothetical protein